MSERMSEAPEVRKDSNYTMVGPKSRRSKFRSRLRVEVFAPHLDSGAILSMRGLLRVPESTFLIMVWVRKVMASAGQPSSLLAVATRCTITT